MTKISRARFKVLFSASIDYDQPSRPRWVAIAALLRPDPLEPKGGHPPIPNRAALTGILFVLGSALPWQMLPAEMGCASGISFGRRLPDWQEVRVWAALHRVLLERLHKAGPVD